MLLSYTSIIITQNNLIHRFYKMVSYTHTNTHITYNVDTRDPIRSNNKLSPGSQPSVTPAAVVSCTRYP